MADFHKPIPTTYNGETYRSRLEARWALFFDKMGMIAQYEPFKIERNGLEYVPDFIVMHGIETKKSWFCSNEAPLIEIKPAPPTQEYMDFLKKIRDPDKSNIIIMLGAPHEIMVGWIIRSLKDGTNIVDRMQMAQCPVCGICYPQIGDEDGNLFYWPHCPFPRLNDISASADFAASYRFDLQNQ